MAASKIDTKKVRIDLGTQSRVTIDPAIVTEYAEAMERGEEFPPIKVYYDMEQDVFILVDGFHRYLAWLKTFPNDMILAEQSLGTVKEAVWESFSVNQSHGLRRTNADKRKAVEGALMHPNGVKMSDRAIAKHCGVSDRMVNGIRAELTAGAKVSHLTDSDEPEYREGLDGKQYPVKPKTVIGTDGIEYPLPDDKPDRLPWQTEEPAIDANTHENYASRLADCSGRKKNEFKRHYDVKDLRCSRCIHIGGDMICANQVEHRDPDAIVCDWFDLHVPYVPVPPKPVENRPLDGGFLPEDTSGKLRKTRIGSNRPRNCIEVWLPKDNPHYFVFALMDSFSRDYLATVLPVLHQRLTEKDDDD